MIEHITHPVVMYSTLFVSQVLNAWMRSWNISCLARHSSNPSEFITLNLLFFKIVLNKYKMLAHLSWQLYGVVWIVSVSLGIKSVLEIDWFGLLIWFVASGLGQEISMRKKK